MSAAGIQNNSSTDATVFSAQIGSGATTITFLNGGSASGFTSSGTKGTGSTGTTLVYLTN